ncbi:uncharacterized protein L3040_006196 [Drepanopeziza brunnea f. sp. 'multigermtubi']|uniref:uncharacterized protein n=1 Tax=Drepanopeziza brunnea f. sp. 'multigermtubi' TaxID=698441 RepID=UPI00239BBF0B|nr:hypothetical protein L3040_006196 [Drepanopeziza brunnea f. sp. 'multigermtubi']
MVDTHIIISAIVAFLAVALGAAYMSGVLDPVAQEMGIWLFKAKAEAEKKKLQAQCMKEGENFVSDNLKGNQQATEVAESFGGIGELKKAF